MAIVLKDRVKVTSAVTGTGTATLGSAVVGFQDFSAIGNGNITYYTIAQQSGGEWEVGKGTVTLSGGIWYLSRDTVYESSAGGTAVSFSAGTKDVFVTYPAERAIYEEPNGQTLIDGGPITILGQNVTVNPSLEAELGKFVGNVDSFGQVYNLNQSNGSSASADFVVYNDETTDGFTHFTDIGINSSNYSSVDYPLFTPGSGYVFHDGDDFFLGNQTANKDVVLFAGGVDTGNEAVRVKGSDQSVELATNLSVAGTADITGAATFGSSVLLSQNPTTALQAATKEYVDNQVTAGLHLHDPVRVETTGNLNATYAQGGTTFNITDITGTNTVTTSVNHGLSVGDQIWLYSTAGNGLSINTAYFVFSTPALNTLTLSLTFGGAQITGLTNASGLAYATRANSGVGATLTNAGTQAALSIDGVALSLNDRVMVRLQTTGYQNGVYTVTTVGSGSTNWVLTRATDSNKVNPADPNGVGTGDYYYTQEGTLNAGDSHVLTTEPNTMIIGYTTLTYTQFSGAVTYTGTAPIDVTGQVISLTGTVAATNGGTGTNTVATGDLLYGSGTNTWSKLPAGAAYKSLVMNGSGTTPEWNAVALNQSGSVSGTLPTTNGGTGLTSYTLGDTVYSDGANSLAKLPGNTSSTKLFLSQTGTGAASAAPAWAQPAASDISGLAPSATTDTTNAANISSGTLPSARLNGSYTGITGVGTLAAGTWNGSTIAANYGGTGQSSYTVGDILYASGSTALSKLPDVAYGNVLLSGGVGTAPSYGKVSLTDHITGTLAVANGGTGVTSSTGSGSVVLSNSPSLTTPDLGTPSAVTLTNGTGLPISTGVSGLGAGVAAFLGTPSSANLATAVTDETGSGALVFANSPTLVTPALGTPSSATLTNATGLPLSTGVTGTLPVANGGTGATSLTANNVILGNGTSAVQTVAPGTAGNVLASNGTTWVSQSAPSPTSVAQQDTNITVADAITTITGSVAAGAGGNFLGSISGTTLTVTTLLSPTPTFVVGAVITGNRVPAGTYITAFGTGTGGTGTYTLNTTGPTANNWSFQCSYGTLTVSAVTSSTIAIGQYLTTKYTPGSSSSYIPSETFITGFGTGTGGTGTYIVSNSFALSSNTIYLGGAITNTVDNNTVSLQSGGNLKIRPTPTVADAAGQILSNRLWAGWSARNGTIAAPAYFLDTNYDGQIISADANAYNNFFTLNNATSLGRMAYASGYGTSGPQAGLGFFTGSSFDALSVATGSAPQFAQDTTGVIFGFASGGPKIMASQRVAGSLNNGHRTTNVISVIAEQVQFNAGVAIGTGVQTVTTSTLTIATTTTALIFNTAADCTVTMPTVAAEFTATIDNGSATAAGTTMTVSAVTAGTLYVGARINGFGIPMGTTITALGTGTGGTGTYTVSATLWISNTTVTISQPMPGRVLFMKNIAAFNVISSAANVVPLNSATPGTAILPNTAGKFAMLMFDGTNWQIMNAN